MDTNFYCTDCEAPIEADEIDEHEARGHDVHGVVRPDRLLSQDPWDHGEDDAAEGGDDVSGDPR
jgi:hypothetical protein